MQKSQSITPDQDILDNQELDTVSIEGASAPRENSYFGYNIFDRSINFFDNILFQQILLRSRQDYYFSSGKQILELVIPLVEMETFFMKILVL